MDLTISNSREVCDYRSDAVVRIVHNRHQADWPIVAAFIVQDTSRN